jgi:chitinase
MVDKHTLFLLSDFLLNFFSGRTFTLKDEKENGLGAESSGSGIAGNFTKTRGFMSYYECCALRKTKDWTTVWLSQSKSHYMFNKNQWISYDDIKSFHLRVYSL